MSRPDPDERISLYPLEGDEVLRRLLGAEEDEGAEAGRARPRGRRTRVLGSAVVVLGRFWHG